MLIVYFNWGGGRVRNVAGVKFSGKFLVGKFRASGKLSGKFPIRNFPELRLSPLLCNHR